MAISTLTELKAAIVDWTARTDLTGASVLNDFITLAEADIMNGVYDVQGNTVVPPLRVRSMETYDGAFAVTGEYTNLPTGFLEAKEVKLTSTTDRPTLKYLSQEAFDETIRASSSGPAVAYTIVGNQIRIGPGASASDTLGLTYWSVVPGLVANSTNWLLTKSPNVYLYGALRHMAPYTGDDNRGALWQQAFITALQGLIRSEKQGSYSGTALAARTVGMSTP